MPDRTKDHVEHNTSNKTDRLKEEHNTDTQRDRAKGNVGNDKTTDKHI